MSHITCDSQREENQAINSCPYGAVPVLVDVEDYWTGEITQEWSTESQCDFQYVSTSKDKCSRCGKIFTY